MVFHLDIDPSFHQPKVIDSSHMTTTSTKKKPEIRKLTTETARSALAWLHNQGDMQLNLELEKESAIYGGKTESTNSTTSRSLGKVQVNTMKVSTTTENTGSGKANHNNYRQIRAATPPTANVSSNPSPSESPNTSARSNSKGAPPRPPMGGRRDSTAIAKDSELTNLKLGTLSAGKNDNRSYSKIWSGISFEWTEHLIYTVIALGMQFAFGHDFAFPDGLNPDTNQACGEGRNHKMCGLELSLERAQAQLRFLTPFVLGGFVVSSVNLWRARRTSYLALCGAVRNMNVNLASLLALPGLLPPGHDDASANTAPVKNLKFQLPNNNKNQEDKKMQKIMQARKTLSRWSLLGFELSVLKARGMIDDEASAVPHLQHLGLLADGEWDAMVPGDRHTTVWMWLQTYTAKLAKEGILTQHELQTLCTATTLIRDRANDLMSALNRDQPLPYASITGLLVNFFLLLNALWKGTVRIYSIPFCGLIRNLSFLIFSRLPQPTSLLYY